MKYRYRVGALLFLLAVITYLDRVCISVAGPRIQEYLHIGPEQWGWVVGVFAIGYGGFEIPGGWMGDRFGPRLVLTRIVLWWSAFTALTGLVSSRSVRNLDCADGESPSWQIAKAAQSGYPKK
jgi:MFS family permease